MRRTDREKSEVRREREVREERQREKTSREWAMMDTARRRRHYATLPDEQYEAFVLAAERQQANVEAALVAAGLTVGKHALEVAKAGISDELTIIANLRAAPDHGVFAGPEPVEQARIFGDEEAGVGTERQLDRSRGSGQ